MALLSLSPDSFRSLTAAYVTGRSALKIAFLGVGASGAWRRGEMTNRQVNGTSIVTNRDGRLELFYTDVGGNLVHRWHTDAGGPWSDEEVLDTGVDSGSQDAVLASTLSDGSLIVFTIGDDRDISMQRQPSPNRGPWSSPAKIHTGSVDALCSAALNKDGRIELFFNQSGALWHVWQTSAGSNSFAPGEPLVSDGGHASVSRNGDGRLEVFYSHAGGMSHRWQSTPGGTWDGPEGLSNSSGLVASFPNKDTRLEVFWMSAKTATFHRWQTAPNNGWSGVERLANATAHVGQELAVGVGFQQELLLYRRVALFPFPGAWRLQRRGQTGSGWSGWITVDSG